MVIKGMHLYFVLFKRSIVKIYLPKRAICNIPRGKKLFSICNTYTNKVDPIAFTYDFSLNVTFEKTNDDIGVYS